MLVRFALVLSLTAGCSSPTPPAPPNWGEEDTVSLIRREWDDCILGRAEDVCMARAKTLAALLPPTIKPLTPCGALCNSNQFCNQGIILTCKVCGFSGTCTTSLPQGPAGGTQP